MTKLGGFTISTWRRTVFTAVAIPLSLFLSGCGTKAASGPSNLTIGGTFAQSSSLPGALIEAAGHALGPIQGLERGLFLQDFSNLSMACATLAVPPVGYAGSINVSTGEFSIEGLPSGTPVRCVIYNSTTSKVVATLVYTNANLTNMDGSSLVVDTVAPTGSSSLGTVALNTTVGVATADASKLIQDNSGIGPLDGWDPTGKYTIQPVTFALPDGYSPLCGSSDHNCHGPQADQGLYLKRVAGKVFTPDATCAAAVSGTGGHSGLSTCAGSAGTDNAYALTLWTAGDNGGTATQALAAFTDCGSKMGASIPEARAYANVDFTDAPEAGNIAVSTSNGSDTITSGWKSSAATAHWPVSNCINLTINGHPASECFDLISSPPTYQVSYQDGGCVDSANNPVAITNWSTQVSPAAGGTCTSGTVPGVTLAPSAHTTGATVTLNSQACPNMYSAAGDGTNKIPVTCSFTGRSFKVSDNSAADPVCGMGSCTMPFVWSHATIVIAGGLCSSITGPGVGGSQLDADKCYANYYHNSLQGAPGLCLRDIRTDWSAPDSAHFIVDDGPVRAKSQAVLAKAIYLPGNVVTMRNTESDFRGVQIPLGSNGGFKYVNCRLLSTETITGTKDGDDIQFVFVSESVLASEDAVCVNADTAGSLGTGKFRTMFRMVKTN